jgi:hypothetical protein
MARFFVILFRKRRDIELLRLDYDTEHLFDNSFIVINYRFRNAIYYRFGNHKTLDKQIKIFNINTFDNEFDLIVYGFFQKKIYKIQFEPKFTLNNDSFKTTISNLSIKLIEQNVPKLAQTSIYLHVEKPSIRSKKIKITNQSIQIKTNYFNQNEFI